jgi:diaminopimelate epimerase
VRDGQTERFAMEIWNADGSRAEMCGNGIRCFAKWLYDRHDLDTTRETIETLAGPRWVEVTGTNREMQIAVGMGVPSFDPASLPMLPGNRVGNVTRLQADSHSIEVTGVSMGNPHAVAFTDHLEAFPLGTVGPLIEHHTTFPERTNFEIVRVSSSGELEVRVWERGAGATLACGTGAAAAAAVAIAAGYVNATFVPLQMPGGQLGVTWEGQGTELTLHGPATTVFSGEWVPQ